MCSFLVAHVAVSVYDVCMTTLFICAVRDAEYFGGRYAPPSLREAAAARLGYSVAVCV